MNNDNNSEETRANAERRLNDMQDSGEINSQEAHNAQVLRGHKAAISNSNTSEQTKKYSQKVIDELEDQV